MESIPPFELGRGDIVDIDHATITELNSQLIAFNENAVGEENPSPISLGIFRDGLLVAAVSGEMSWGCLYVASMFVHPEYRHYGLGAQLLDEIETRAIQQGCSMAFLDTFTFPAVEFYVRRGYQEFGRLEGYPPGHARVYLSKPLV